MIACGAATDECLIFLVLVDSAWGRTRETGKAKRVNTTVSLFFPPSVSFGACGRLHLFVYGTAAD